MKTNSTEQEFWSYFGKFNDVLYLLDDINSGVDYKDAFFNYFVSHYRNFNNICHELEEKYKSDEKQSVFYFGIAVDFILQMQEALECDEIKTIMIREEIFDRREAYQIYLQSGHWQIIRKKALLNAENKCQLCNSDKKLNVHHRTYKNLGDEDIKDLTVLCKDCHKKFHNK